MSGGSTTEFKAYACHGKGEPLVPFAYTPRPLGPNDVEIRIAACGICGSDIHTMDSGWGPTPYPVVPGHEIVGVATQVGAQVKKIRVGDRVGVGPIKQTCDGAKKCDSCSKGLENLCVRSVPTYAGFYKDGAASYGGYAEGVRVHEQWTFKIPDALTFAEAAPLLCAGVTVFAPLKRAGITKGMRVGVVGIGGLGHLAIQYAVAMGAEVVAISHSESKKGEAEKLGAKGGFLVSSKKDEMKRARMSLDVVIVTALSDQVKPGAFDAYLGLVKAHGTVILVGVPESPIPFWAFSVIGQQRAIVGSSIGSPAETQEALEFAAKHGVKPWIETEKMSRCGEAVARVRKGDVRFRMVLLNGVEQARSKL
ncbi:chaperonin 10-like protein [Cladochytrium replicatum]|nr:chaperonin 10-like protein [Cladochytrium replicatum]